MSIIFRVNGEVVTKKNVNLSTAIRIDALSTVPSPVLYEWSMVELPYGSRATLAIGAGEVGFTVDRSGSFVIELTVDRGLVSQSTGRVTISAISSSYVLPPTGITKEIRTNSVDLYWVSNSEENLRGYNVYRATQTAGGEEGYTQINENLVTRVDSIVEDKVDSEKTVTESGNINRAPGEGLLYRTTTTDESFDILEKIKYSDTTGVPGTTYYYVLTAVVNNGTEDVESAYSEEISAAALAIPVNVDFPIRSSLEVSFDFIKSALNYNLDIDVAPGKVFRDVLVDIPSSEFERSYILLRFFSSIAQSFISLMDFDDADGDGISDRFEDSAEKRTLKAALGFESDDAVQSLIDISFDRLAANCGVFRGEATKASGTAIFYTNSTFSIDLTIPAGTRIASTSNETIVFTSLATKTMYASLKTNYWNASERRYEISIPIEAEASGADGNVSAGSINRMLTSLKLPVIIQAVNNYATTGGQDKETNNRLAERAMLAFVAVDPGTKQGYRATLLALPLVQAVHVIEAGNDVMMRDYDDVRQKHIGGKVDIYIRGEQLVQNEDVYEFFFSVVSSWDLVYQSAEALYTFDLDTGNVVEEGWDIVKIVSILNVTQNEFYYRDSINDSSLITVNGERIKIDPSLVTTYDPLDEVIVTFWYDHSNNYIPKKQPVDSIVSLIGDSCGNLYPTTDLFDSSGFPITGAPSAAGYELWKVDDPLWLGESIQASDQVRIYYNAGEPTGEYFSNSEEIILTGTARVYLSKVGVDESYPITVLGKTSGILFTENVDYQIVSGTSFVTDSVNKSTPPQIQRLASGSIVSGETVVVTYRHRENMTLTYLVNSLIETGQTKIDEPTNRHVTADVVVKQAHEVPIDITSYIQFEDGYDVEVVKFRIQDNLQSFFAKKRQGQSVYQSEIIKVMQATEGVVYVRQPLTLMHRSNGSAIIRELVVVANSSAWTVFDSGTEITYKTANNIFDFPTGVNGGVENRFRGVFQESEQLTFVDTVNEVKTGEGLVYISEQNAIYASLKYGTNINLYNWYATYILEGETGTKDVLLEDLEYPGMGNLAIFEI